MTPFFHPSLIQLQRLQDAIKLDPATFKWTEGKYQRRAFKVDKKGWCYTIKFIFDTGWLYVGAEHPLGGGFKKVWDQEGEKIRC